MKFVLIEFCGYILKNRVTRNRVTRNCVTRIRVTRGLAVVNPYHFLFTVKLVMSDGTELAVGGRSNGTYISEFFYLKHFSRVLS